MSPEALALGALSAVRAVPMAIVSALLLAARPRRHIAAYVASGVVVSLVVGVAAVVVFEPEARSDEQGTARTLVDLVLGVLALGFALAYGRGWIGGPPRAGDDDRDGDGPGLLSGRGPLGRVGERLRHPTVPSAAAAGALTNLPGVYFLAGLVAILATGPTVIGGALQVVVYTVLRFGGPLAVLVLVVLRPDATVGLVRRAHAWGRRHRRVLVGGVVGVVGAYLVVESVLALV